MLFLSYLLTFDYFFVFSIMDGVPHRAELHCADSQEIKIFKIKKKMWKKSENPAGQI